MIDISKADLFCLKCGNENPNKFVWRGKWVRGTRRFQCDVCGAWGNTNTKRLREDYFFTNKGGFAEVEITTEERIRTPEQLIRILQLDTKTWEIEKFLVGKSESYRKDRRVEWEVRNGLVTNGSVHDTGKLLIRPLFSVKVWLRRKTQEIRNALAVEDLKKDVKRFTHRYKKIKYPVFRDGMLYEVEMPDIHLGRVTWGEENGEDSDVESQIQLAITSLQTLLRYVKDYPVERILFPIGNDFFNADNKFGMTTNGTPQQEDVRWKKTFRDGRILATTLIDLCSAIAPVDVIQIPGNHDEQRSFYLGDALEAWYHKNPNVRVNNSPTKRKYYSFGNSLIGFAHGDGEKLTQFMGIMANEAPDLWAKSRFREWHTGNKHHKEDLIVKTQETDGVVIRLLRSLAATDDWHYTKGFNQAIRASEGFLWSKDQGLVAQFTAIVPKEKG